MVLNESAFAKKAEEICAQFPDPTHDYSHVLRVVRAAKQIASKENANLDVVIPAAYFHDFVLIEKNDPRRSQASKLSADAAIDWLRTHKYPEELLPQIHHAIAAHSFSAKIEAKSLEAKVVQDADRLDGLGNIGMLRCFGLGSRLNREFYNKEDPFAESGRPLNDQINSLDHIYIKLFKVAETLHTDAAKTEGKIRLQRIKDFLEGLRNEIG
ncbi:MAG: HD domain-containing protein [Bdellovibrionota bacterium]